jgi:hypothetical protein
MAEKRRLDENSELQPNVERQERLGPLCEFLELPVPQEEFPHINDRTEFLNRIIDGSLESLTQWREREATVDPSFAVNS